MVIVAQQIFKIVKSAISKIIFRISLETMPKFGDSKISVS